METAPEPVHATLTLANNELVHYWTHGPLRAAKTFVLLHGAPGANTDFKYLAPLLLAEPDTNVIAFDLPGSGQTSIAAAGGIAGFSSTAIADAVVEALPQLGLKNMFLLGHSMGGQTSMLVAANPALAPTLRGLALLNPTGFSPHQSCRPYVFAKLWASALRYLGDGPNFLQGWTHSFYLKWLGFPKSTPPLVCVAAMLHVASPDFERIKASAHAIKGRGVPTFMALAADDRIIEVSLGKEVASVLEPSVLKEYAKGGHNIQKTQAADLGPALVAWSHRSML
ncbi:hypothetical protein SDRG_02430 [Saprolegnia diclina VS20]|uniref:AB hydrolase-1 domain-containing protein n=1 Tax=Saprolegnia diclina (strain VS20) TaxID=1156394 RepID=T0R2L6_SAPDV|nr:hypothetical protein SDRG_02430 [Saprolegnia diclina VS20]EQC40540.1 hypothetical protein SDRG_02430 [Saprolegnia diclina VS20]|eukprot:XP_008606239.1 hypothetical protein SDRG_02430 [Saprolegnia diclina VS20]